MGNYMVVANDNDYPKKDGISALIGIYKTHSRAEDIKRISSTKYTNSTYSVEETEHECTEPIEIKLTKEIL